MPLAGRIALVTGASRGIGQATAVELARRGAHVVITGRSQAGLEETDDAIRALGGTATLLPLDLTDGAALETIGPSLFERFRRLDILVSNAGTLGVLTPATHILPADWRDAVAVNATAHLHLIRSCGPLLLQSDAGRAVFVTSRIVLRPTAYFGIYGATKAALHHLVTCPLAEGDHRPARTWPIPARSPPSCARPVSRRGPDQGSEAAGGGARHRRDVRGRRDAARRDGAGQSDSALRKQAPPAKGRRPLEPVPAGGWIAGLR